VPINFTREARFRHDPALSIPPLPTLSVAGDLDHHGAETLGFALNHLVRGQNRVASALNAARRMVEAA
jgi:N-acetylated-alpha-linked acidic dipeptidase